MKPGPMKPRAVLLPVSFLLAVLVTGCDRETSTPPVHPGAPIVLISIDTLRSDRLPVYGYDAVETPAIDALARDALVFERAYSHYPLTLPSHISLLTGVLPTEHGVRDNVGYRFDSSAFPYLPRRLEELGYQNGAAVSTYLLRADIGLGEGFDFFEDSFSLRSGAALVENQRSGFETAARAIDWLEEVAPGGDPFFLFLHLYEPHTPYEPPEPYASRYDDPYDGEVAASDAIVGEVMDTLEELGVYDDAIIVLLSDHGEGLGDHGESEHGILLYREALEVPLLVKLPGSALAGERVAAPAGLVDVAPTLLALLGEEVEATTLFDLRGENPPERSIYAETYYPRLHLGWSELTSLVRDELHYIEGPDPELYDLLANPAETDNLLASRRQDYWTLRDEMKGLRRELAAPAEVDAETAERLATLGYLSRTVETGDGPLPDPKTQLPILDELRAASHHQIEGRFEEAIALYEKVLAGSPGIVDAWESLALCYQALSRYAEAEAAYKEAMERSQGADHVALGAARLYLEMGRLDDARNHADLAVATNPARAHLTLARIALAAGELETAAEEAEKALEVRPNAVAPSIVLAQVAVARGDLDAAAEQIARAEREQAKRQEAEVPTGLFFMKGEIAARRGEARTAEDAYREEIRLHPSNTRAYSSLALLYALEGRGADSVGVVRQMVETLGTPRAYAAAVETLRILGDPRGADRLLRHAQGLFPGHPELEGLS